ncbi:hypothetical protein C8R43DRAFT_1245407 [Mycena crocata]|nr:hypothetical protein C8R43DRAFT_1245407 [Mycena crocata]
MRSIAGSLRCQKPHLRHFSSSKPRWRLSPPRRRLHLTDIDYTTGVVGKAAEGNRFSKPHYDVSGRSLLCYPSLSGGGFASFSPTCIARLKSVFKGYLTWHEAMASGFDAKYWQRLSTAKLRFRLGSRATRRSRRRARWCGSRKPAARRRRGSRARATFESAPRATRRSRRQVAQRGSVHWVVSGSTHAPCLARELAQCTRTPTPHRQALLDSRKCIGAALARRDWIQRLAGSDTRVGSDAPRGRSDWCARVCREERAVGEVAARIGADSGDVTLQGGVNKYRYMASLIE